MKTFYTIYLSLLNGRQRRILRLVRLLFMLAFSLVFGSFVEHLFVKEKKNATGGKSTLISYMGSTAQSHVAETYRYIAS